MVQIERKSGVKGQIVSVEQWMNGEELVKQLGLANERSLEWVRKQYPNCFKKIGKSRLIMYNIAEILGS